VTFVVLDVKPRFAPYFIKQSIKAFDEANLNEALMYSKIAARLDPLEPQVHYMLGEIYARRQIYGIAIKEHKKALELNPLFPKAYFSLGQIYLEMRRYQEALDELQKLLNIDPANREAKELIGSIKHLYSLQLINNAIDSYQQGRRDEARRFLQIAYNVRYSHLYNLFEIINMYAANAKSDKLINSWGKILRLDPKYKLAYSLLGDIYLENTEYKKAKDAYRKFLDIEPNDASIHHNLAVAYNRLKMYDEAIDEFRIALSLIPDNPNIIYGLALTYKDKKMYEEAINLFKYLLRSGYDFTYAYLDIAQIHKEMGEIQNAKNTIQEVIKLCNEKLTKDPNNTIYRIVLDKARAQLKEYESAKDSSAK
jgi:tetratricopeptide (TPR) repeat protein